MPPLDQDSACADVDRRLARDPVAVVGMAGRFPKAGDVQEFWENVVAGRDCSDVVPESWWSTKLYHDPDPFAPDKTYCRRGGFLTPEVFDPREFGMPPNTVDSTGLVQLLGLVVAKETLGDAGLGRADWFDPARTGVVLGVCGTNSTLIPLAARLLVPQMAETMAACGVPEEQARRVLRARLSALPPWTEDSFPGILGNVVSGRIANRLNLGAANHTVDAACASSLAALRSAVDELVSRRADLMLSGGCDADNSIVSFLCFSKTPALSPSGRVRPFDAEADGTLVGEGVGMVALKRLADAERDGDRIYAVLRGLGSSSDGRAQSIYAPCGEGQLTALRRAYEDAGCSPRSVELVEAHGTGTPAGDEVELSALNELLASPDDRRYVAVGSVKSQIGHAKAAAGVAGLIKAALALHHRVLPPTINVRAVNPQAARDDAALYVNTRARPWVRDASRTVRRAGVSAFGFGGVNYHAVLEEYGGDTEAAARRPLHRVPRAHVWHAPDARQLLDLLERGADSQEEPPPSAHARVGFVAEGAEEYAELVALAAQLIREKAGEESGSHPRGVHYRAAALPGSARVAALFPGQGSQYVGMGRRAALALPPVRAAFDAANALFPSADSLARAVFPPPLGEDPAAEEERLRRTAYAQSAIGALSMGHYRWLRELGFAPGGVLGHSFGEVTALWAAGVLGDDAFTGLARARGRAMEPDAGGGADAGAMAAVRMAAPALDDVLAEHPELTVCNRNSPEDHAVGGPTSAVTRFVEVCAERGLPVRRLPVAAAFHTAHVGHAAEAFAAACRDTGFAEPRVPVYADTAGASYGRGPAADRDTLVEQLRRPVDFAARLEEMYADGVRVFVECGPGRALTQLVERTLDGGDVHAVACDRGPRGDDCAALLRAAVQLVVLGAPLTGLNRYAAPARGGRSAPSKVARVLDGPLFAVEKLRPGYEKLLAETAAETRREQAGQAAGPARAGEAGEAPAAAGGALPSAAGWSPPEDPSSPAEPRADDPLARAAAEHLAAHARYLDGQLRTAEHLTGLLAEGAGAGRVEPSLAAAIDAVAEHSLALGETHAKAGQVVADLLRLPQADAPGAVRSAGAAPPPDGEEAGKAAQAAGGWPPDGEGEGEGGGGREAVALVPRQGGPAGAPAPAADGPEAGGRSALARLWAAERAGGAGESAESEEAEAQTEAAGQASEGSSPVDAEELEQVFRAVIAEKTGYDIDMIEPDMLIQEDLGIDSLKQVDIGAEMWRRYPVIGRGELYRFSEARTVEQLTAMMYEVVARPRPRLLTALRDARNGRGTVTLRELPPVDVCTDAFADPARALLVDDGGELCGVLAESLASRGWDVHRLALPGTGRCPRWPADGDEAAVQAALREALPDGARLDLCVLPFGRPAAAAEAGTEAEAEAGLEAEWRVARLRQAVLVAKHVRPLLEAAAEDGRRAGLVAATELDGALGYAGSGGDTAHALAGGLCGLVKALAVEATTLFCRAVDLAPELSVRARADAFLAEIGDIATDVREVGVDAAGRRCPVVSGTAPPPPAPAPAQGLGEDDVLLVTGGAGGITAWCVEALAAEHRCGYLLLGRTPLEDGPEGEPEWAAECDDEDALRSAAEERARRAGEDPAQEAVRARVERQVELLRRQRAVRSRLAALRARGVRADYVSADVRDASSVAAALAPHASRITGVLHGAGLLRDRPLADVDARSVADVVDTKLAGLRHVLNVLDTDRLRHLVLFSSVAGIWGNVRQVDYALANEALNRFGCAFREAHPGCRVQALAWGPWTGGMAADVQEMFTTWGVPLLSREEGCAYFVEQMAPDRPGSGTVTVIGPTSPLYHRWESLPPAGRTAHRSVAGLGEEPVLRDHRFGKVPVLPMTAAVGWALNTVERALGGHRPVVECRDVRIARGLYFTGGRPERLRVHLAPQPADEDAVRVAVRDAEEAGQLHYEGVFRHAERAAEPPVVHLPPVTCEEALHPAYGDGRLFHGPALRGLRNVLEQSGRRLTVAARLADPPLARGSFAGRLFSPGPADLLLQAGLVALLPAAGGSVLPVPVGVERVELFAPLPDDAPFVITAEVHDDEQAASPFFSVCTLTACAPGDGSLLQRWTGVRTLWADTDAIVDGITARSGADAGRG